MKNNKQLKLINKININIVIAVGFTLSFFIAIILKNNGIMYEMNDDIVMKSIVSGLYLGGTPSYQMVFSVFPINFILYVLYNITIKLDWYGIILIGATMFYLTYTIYSIIKQKESIIEKISYACGTIFIVSFSYAVFLINITFTTIAAFIATCCLVLYTLPSSKLKNLIMTVGICLAYGIRPDSCLMIIVFFLPVFLYKNIGNIEGIKKDFILGLKIGAILLVCIIIQQIMVSNPEWKEYSTYNKNRSRFYDYYYGTIITFPKEEVTEIFHKAGFSDEEMELICGWGEIGLLDNLPERMSNLVEECEKHMDKISYDSFISTLINMLDYIKRLSKYYIIILFILGYYVIKSKDRKKKIPIFLLLFIIQFGMISYLIYQRRWPERVLVPLFTSYIVVNMAMLLKDIKVKDIIKKILNYDKVFGVIVSIILYVLAINNIKCDISTRYIADESNQILEYFKQYPDNTYIYDKFTLENFRFKNLYRTSNYIKYDATTLKEVLFKENVFLVLSNSELEKNKVKYEFLFGEDANIELVDQINGESIYKITKK